MILDLQTMFSGSVASDGTKTGQAITATAISANVLDLRNGSSPTLADEAIQGGGGLFLEVYCTVAAAGGDAAKTLTITIESDSTADLATSATVHGSTTAILGSAITAGALLWRTQLPSGAIYERYMGLRYTVSAGFTAFRVVAHLTPAPQRNTSYAAGFTIDV